MITIVISRYSVDEISKFLTWSWKFSAVRVHILLFILYLKKWFYHFPKISWTFWETTKDEEQLKLIDYHVTNIFLLETTVFANLQDYLTFSFLRDRSAQILIVNAFETAKNSENNKTLLIERLAKVQIAYSWKSKKQCP